MNKIEKLINQYCPKGVKYKSLGMISSYAVSRIDAKELNALNYVGVDNLLPNKLGKEDSNYVPSEGRFIKFCKGDILIGNIRPYLKKIWLATHDGGTNGDVLTIQIDNQDILQPQFLYYILSSDSFFQYDMQNAKGAKMPRGNKEAVMKYQVPIPPVEVQHEIVRILDNFTKFTSELIAELTAELTARKKQYEYYRNTLLVKKVGKMIRWLKLGEVGKVSMCKRIMKAETSSIGDIPFYKIGTFGGTANSFISKNIFNKYKKEYSYPKKGDVLISAAGTIGRAVIFDGEPAYFQDSNIVWIDNDESVVLNKYLFYYYQLSPWKVSEGGTIPRLYNDNIASTKIAVPSIEEQEMIIDILDRLNMLCDSLATELLSEIETRQKQYEYYRDKLLNFKELCE